MKQIKNGLTLLMLCLCFSSQAQDETEKKCVVNAYEAGLITAQSKLNIEAVDYFTRFYSDPNENTDARIDMYDSQDPGYVRKRKRKRITRQTLLQTCRENVC